MLSMLTFKLGGGCRGMLNFLMLWALDHQVHTKSCHRHPLAVHWQGTVCWLCSGQVLCDEGLLVLCTVPPWRLALLRLQPSLQFTLCRTTIIFLLRRVLKVS